MSKRGTILGARTLRGGAVALVALLLLVLPPRALFASVPGAARPHESRRHKPPRHALPTGVARIGVPRRSAHPAPSSFTRPYPPEVRTAGRHRQEFARRSLTAPRYLALHRPTTLDGDSSPPH